MYRLRHAIDNTRSRSSVHVYYHVYKDNCDDDMLKMRDLANELGFYFTPGWAYFMGLEKLLAYADGAPKFTDEDRQTLERTVVSLDEALAISREARSPSCSLQTDRMVINHDGSVALCCTVYDPVNFIAPDYLSVSLAELQQRKIGSATCTKCMAHALHDYAQYNPNSLWDDVAHQRQVESGQPVTIKMFPPQILVRKDRRTILDRLARRK